MTQSFSAAAAQLVHLSGPERGRTRRVFGTTHLVPLEDGRLKLVYAQPRVGDQPVAVLAVHGDGWHIDVEDGTEAWVNGTRAGNRLLHAGDLIEIGDRGLLLRFRPRVAGAAYKSVREALDDCLGCARFGGHGTLDRIGIIVGGTALELATQVRPIVRAAFALGAVALVAGVGLLWARNTRLKHELDLQLQRVEGLAELMAASERAAFTIDDFDDVRSQLDFRIDDTLARVEALENRATARGRVISEASSAVVFVQGAYRFVEPRSGRVLRSAEPSSGIPDAVRVEGNGPPLELRYTGTGFVLAELDLVATNRHVALPWEFDDAARRLIEQGFTPIMQRLVGYLPGIGEPFDLSVQASHAQADVAILHSVDLGDHAAGLRLAEALPGIGDEVLVLGYPAGIRALLARAEPTFVSRLLSQGSVGFWDLAGHLARGDHVAPLATVGSIGQITAGAIVYDAETTHGGSGGPVLTLDGAVVAVNAAVLPEFSGSNLGVPVQRLRQLLAP
ncbi:MAG TPA: trypsin-like peptidase domain-containing protein [Acidobacteriota bacterium]|nr:trypsin-like peptidase domain-containing protein [Acidobacteriota bacterium]